MITTLTLCTRFEVTSSVRLATIHGRLGLAEWTPMDDLGSASLAQPHTGSPETMALAERWLLQCRHSHRMCFDSDRPAWYPSRLLKVEGQMARLIDFVEERPTGPYATLSHCWGTEKFFVLTSRSLGMLRRGLPVRLFPLTFYHAMFVAQRLAFQYLWIDCYCSLQGDDEASLSDWVR